MKKIIVSVLIIFIIIVLLNIRQILGTPVIGKITGIENEQLIIRGEKYERDDDSSGLSKYKGKYLGTAATSDNKMKMRLYTLEGDNYTDCIYALWEWEGMIYTKVK